MTVILEMQDGALGFISFEEMKYNHASFCDVNCGQCMLSSISFCAGSECPSTGPRRAFELRNMCVQPRALELNSKPCRGGEPWCPLARRPCTHVHASMLMVPGIWRWIWPMACEDRWTADGWKNIMAPAFWIWVWVVWVSHFQNSVGVVGIGKFTDLAYVGWSSGSSDPERGSLFLPPGLPRALWAHPAPSMLCLLPMTFLKMRWSISCTWLIPPQLWARLMLAEALRWMNEWIDGWKNE